MYIDLKKKLNRKNKYLNPTEHHKKHTIDKCEIRQAFPKQKILLILQQVSVKIICLQ